MTSEQTPSLELHEIEKSFAVVEGLGRGRRQVVRGLSLRVMPGEIFGFIGLNGAGKTTTIKVALGLIHADSGRISCFGAPLARLDWGRVGFAPEKPSFNENLTAEEILDFAVRLLGRRPEAARREAVLRRVDLLGARAQKVGQFSKGMQQRLALAAAMIHDPDLLILDEPSSGLDPLGRALIKEIMRELKAAGKSIFFSTHILPDVSELCDRIGIIHEGRLVYCGPLAGFAAASADLEQRFMDLVRAQPAVA